MIFNNILETIGNTPIIRISNINTFSSEIYVKFEGFNPCSSIKDRVAVNMIKKGFEKKLINKNSVIIEPTSGNTGIGLAMTCASMGLRLILTMPETMSIERKRLLEYFGAELILTPGNQGMKGAISKAYELNGDIKDSYVPFQFSNPANPETHYNYTGPEIWRQMNGDIDVLVCGIGTGGTISGCGKYLKERRNEITVIGIEPFNSSVISGEKPGAHKIQGIGAGFIPENLDRSILNDIIRVTDEEAFQKMSMLAEKEGIFCGISSGAAFSGALYYAEKNMKKDKILVILPDSGDRYLSVIS